MRDVALVPQRDVLERRRHRSAHDTCEAGQVFGQDRVALVRHRRRSLLTGREVFLGLAHLAALQVADFDGEALDRAGDDTERGEEHGVAVARDDLRRDWLDRKTQLVGNMCLDTRVDVGEGADGARDRAGRDAAPRRLEPFAVARELGIGLGQFQPEGGRLGMDAVAAANAQRVLVLEGAPFQRLEERIDVIEQQARRTVELNRETGVEHVGRRHALMDEARLVADMLGEIGQEGDDVVLGLALDFLDARDVDVVERRLAALPDGPRGLGWHDAEFSECVQGMRLDLVPRCDDRVLVGAQMYAQRASSRTSALLSEGSFGTPP